MIVYLIIILQNLIPVTLTAITGPSLAMGEAPFPDEPKVSPQEDVSLLDPKETQATLFENLMQIDVLAPAIEMLMEKFPQTELWIYGSLAEAEAMGDDIVDGFKNGVFSDIDAKLPIEEDDVEKLTEHLEDHGYTVGRYLPESLIISSRRRPPDYSSLVASRQFPLITARLRDKPDKPQLALYLKPPSTDTAEQSRELISPSYIKVKPAEGIATLDTQIRDGVIPFNTDSKQAEFIRDLSRALDTDDFSQLHLNDEQASQELYWILQLPTLILKRMRMGMQLPDHAAADYLQPVYEFYKAIREKRVQAQLNTGATPYKVDEGFLRSSKTIPSLVRATGQILAEERPLSTVQIGEHSYQLSNFTAPIILGTLPINLPYIEDKFRGIMFSEVLQTQQGAIQNIDDIAGVESTDAHLEITDQTKYLAILRLLALNQLTQMIPDDQEIHSMEDYLLFVLSGCYLIDRLTEQYTEEDVDESYRITHILHDADFDLGEGHGAVPVYVQPYRSDRSKGANPNAKGFDIRTDLNQLTTRFQKVRQEIDNLVIRNRTDRQEHPITPRQLHSLLQSQQFSSLPQIILDT